MATCGRGVPNLWESNCRKFHPPATITPDFKALNCWGGLLGLSYKPLFLTPFGLLPLGTAPSQAADLPVKAPVVADPYLPLWTGWYIGAHLGAISDRSRFGSFLPAPLTPGGGVYCWALDCAFNQGQTATGLLGGIQLGYNFQTGALVYGVETDLSLSTAKTTGTGSASFFGLWTAETGSRAFGTTRLRLGYAFDRSLLYATGGLAYANMRNRFQPCSPPFCGITVPFTSATGWRVGYTIGGGWEYSIARNWSVKAEALYYGLGTRRVTALDAFGSTYGLTDRMTGWVARGGINYQFR